MKNADLPAMPNNNPDTYPIPCAVGYGNGLTKRKMFAMHAMQALIASGGVFDASGSNKYLISTYAVEHADSLLKELEK